MHFFLMLIGRMGHPSFLRASKRYVSLPIQMALAPYFRIMGFHKPALVSKPYTVLKTSFSSSALVIMIPALVVSKGQDFNLTHFLTPNGKCANGTNGAERGREHPYLDARGTKSAINERIPPLTAAS